MDAVACVRGQIQADVCALFFLVGKISDVRCHRYTQRACLSKKA